MQAALVLLALLPALSGCAGWLYERTATGRFVGKLTVEWIGPNRFLYRPDPQEPLVYTASDGRRIQPQQMITDGGSIPRLFWSAPNFGPWDFAPGYIVHDWLFHQHQCQLADWQQFSFDDSARLLAEGLKTQMEKAGQAEPTVVWAVYEAVRSPIAERLWSQAPCQMPPSVATTPPIGGGPTPIVILKIEAR